MSLTYVENDNFINGIANYCPKAGELFIHYDTITITDPVYRVCVMGDSTIKTKEIGVFTEFVYARIFAIALIDGVEYGFINITPGNVEFVENGL